MRYVDGFVLAVPKRKLDACRRMSLKAGKVWREHGALEYVECVGDDSRAHRDRVNAKVMKDRRAGPGSEAQSRTPPVTPLSAQRDAIH